MDWFQSYQFMQINPDSKYFLVALYSSSGFNRINSCRSIPTRDLGFFATRLIAFQSYQFMQINPDQQKFEKAIHEHTMFQSYQFMQINPDIYHGYIKFTIIIVSIVSIHADQSRRTHVCEEFLSR